MIHVKPLQTGNFLTGTFANNEIQILLFLQIRLKFWEKVLFDTLFCSPVNWMDHPNFIVFNLLENLIGLKREDVKCKAKLLD